jgi:hypothetical protein
MCLSILQAQGEAPPIAGPSFWEVISVDENVTLKTIVNIHHSIMGIVDKVQALLVYWEKKYKMVWDQDKEAYMRSVHGTATHLQHSSVPLCLHSLSVLLARVCLHALPSSAHALAPRTLRVPGSEVLRACFPQALREGAEAPVGF